MGKVWAVVVSAVLLGAQLSVVLPFTGLDGNWFWPVMNYPMFSWPHYEGYLVQFHELRALSCDGREPPRALGFEDLRIRTANFYYALSRLSEINTPYRSRVSEAEAVRTDIEQRFARYFPAAFCGAELWEKSLRLAPDMRQKEPVPWRLVYEWKFAPGAGSLARPDGERAAP